jgi:glycosyltransferase involved in cell wall biosynthesis/predicted O-methyltransferase YrrM
MSMPPPSHYRQVQQQVESIQGFMMPGQEQFLFDKVKSLPDDAVIVEIGSYKGRSTAAMAYACIGTNRRIFSIDTWNGNDVDFAERDFFHVWQGNLAARGLEQFVTPLRGFSHEMVPRWNELGGGRVIDFAFIDGSHDFPDVLNDLKLVLPLVKEGGWIGFHDVIQTWPGPLRVWHHYARRTLVNHQYVGSLAAGQKTAQSQPIFDELAKKPIDPLPVHFFTICLNGEPYIRHHIEQFKELPFQWHWHIIEGAAQLVNDTSWSVPRGGNLPNQFHRNGLSIDGTTEYLDELARAYPENVSVYRKPRGQLWDGKIEMVNAPLPYIVDDCVLWEIDTDELWTAEQLVAGRKLFLDNPDSTAAYYWCWCYVGPDLVISNRYVYGNIPEKEWLRTWRFRPGMMWATHEPPMLVEHMGNNQWRDVAQVKPMLHAQTEAAGLVFHHCAYALQRQVRFKQDYYGYAGAVASWLKLQRVNSWPVRLKDFMPWVTDGAEVNSLANLNIPPVIEFPPEVARTPAPGVKRPTIVLDGVLFQTRPTGGPARMWWSLLQEWSRDGFGANLVVLNRGGNSLPPIANVRVRPVPAVAAGNDVADRQMLLDVCEEECGDVFVSTGSTSLPAGSATPTVAVIAARPTELSAEGAAEVIAVSQSVKDDVLTASPHVSVTVAPCGIWPIFSPASEQAIVQFRQRRGIVRPYFLVVGRRDGDNNIALVARAWSELQSPQEHEIICIGGAPQIEFELSPLAQAGALRLIGQVADAELAAAYSGAAALLCPSTYEAFGFAILEAMACGCPVITSRAGGIPEVAGDAPLYVDPKSPAELADAMREVLKPEVRQRMRGAGVSRVSKFRWNEMAKSVREVLLRAASSRVLSR